ncbi:MAG: PHB depolymerase family esterase [Alphaproteobacteria bacterium]|nr:PHB depolymerase family esterase [Alphaproteobacteria bacterium]
MLRVARFILGMAVVWLLAMEEARAAELRRVGAFGENPGDLEMYEYVPDALADRPALVVALHGCAQKASDYLTATGWKALADRLRFIVVLPQQTWSNNPTRCFRWWASDSLTRGTGEPRSIAAMVHRTAAVHGIDRARVFVTGLSAGGAMSVVMTALYPELFAGGAPIAGVPFACADGLMGAVSCMMSPPALSPGDWGGKVRAAAKHPGPWPRLSIWQGSGDAVVAPESMDGILAQWTDLQGLERSAAAEEKAGPLTRRLYRDGNGRALVETNMIADMPHGVPIDPGNGCGEPRSHIIDARVCSTERIAAFWGLR